MPDLESKNCQARCNVENLACNSVPSSLFQKCCVHPGVFPMFVSPCGLCVLGSGCRSAAVPKCHIYWCFQESIVLYLSPLLSFFYENAGVFFKFITSYFPICELLSTTFSILIWKLTGKLALFCLQNHCLVRRNEELDTL